MRGIFFDEDAVRAVERRLLGDGYEVTVSRERYAGEDDDADHPWSLRTDAPPIVLEVLVDTYDGWFDDGTDDPGDTATPAVTDPLPLPDAPRRTTRD